MRIRGMLRVVESRGHDLQFGQSVHDNAGQKVGEIDHVDGDHGWFRVQLRPLSMVALHVPFKLVNRVDGRDVFLAVSNDELRRAYNHPPAREIVVEEAGGYRFAVTRQANGVDGSTMVVHRIDIDQVSRQVGEGYQVLTWEDVSLGIVSRYDATTGWMLVQQTSPGKRERLVPVTAVERVDRPYWEVYLTVAESDLDRMPKREPVDVVFIGGKPASAVDSPGAF